MGPCQALFRTLRQKGGLGPGKTRADCQGQFARAPGCTLCFASGTVTPGPDDSQATPRTGSTSAAIGIWGAGLAFALALISCGGDSDRRDASSTDAGSGAGGESASGGSGSGSGGGQGTPGPVPCGVELCQPLVFGPLPPAPACCADESESLCGLDTSLLASFSAVPTRDCEPFEQPGPLDRGCPESAPFDTGSGIQVPPFAGCCSETTGACGYFVDRVLLFPIGLGCIDSAPFLDGEPPAPCGGGTGGATNE